MIKCEYSEKKLDDIIIQLNELYGREFIPNNILSEKIKIIKDYNHEELEMLISGIRENHLTAPYSWLSSLIYLKNNKGITFDDLDVKKNTKIESSDSFEITTLKEFLYFYKWSIIPIFLITTIISLMLIFYDFKYSKEIIRWSIEWGFSEPTTIWWKAGLGGFCILFTSSIGLSLGWLLIQLPAFILHEASENKKWSSYEKSAIREYRDNKNINSISNGEFNIIVAIKEFLYFYPRSRVPIFITFSIINSTILYFLTFYIITEIIPWIIEWGLRDNPIIWWKPGLVALGFFYIFAGAYFAINFGFFIPIMFILSVIIEEKKSKKFKHFKEKYDEKEILISYGDDLTVKNIITNFVKKIGLHPIILRTQMDIGKTIEEQFKHNTSKPGFIIIILTPDDIGCSVSSADKKKLRARQDVILELGFFIGLMGKDRVFALIKGEVEKPHYYMNEYIPMDDNNLWKLKLEKAMKKVHMDIKTLSPDKDENSRTNLKIVS